jgi:hypothetical protein
MSIWASPCVCQLVCKSVCKNSPTRKRISMKRAISFAEVCPHSWLMTNLTHSFSVYLFHASTCFEQQVLIIRRTNLYQYIIWYNTLWWMTVLRAGQGTSIIHQSVLYQMMCWYKLVLQMMSTCCSKHVKAWNKYIKKECVKLVINHNYVEMHGQQNIKLCLRLYACLKSETTTTTGTTTTAAAATMGTLHDE